MRTVKPAIWGTLFFAFAGTLHPAAAESPGRAPRIHAVDVHYRLHDNNRMIFAAFNDGSIGDRAPFRYFTFDGMYKPLFEGQLVVGKSPAQVSGGVAAHEYLPQSRVLPFASDLTGFEQACQARFTDGEADHPMGISVLQRSYSKSSDPDREYVIVEYWIKNTTAGDFPEIYAGLAMDWDVGGGDNLAGYDKTRQLAYMAEPGSSGDSHYYGVAVLTGNASGYAAWMRGDDDNSDSVMFGRMIHFSNDQESSVSDWRTLVSAGPYAVPAGDSVRCVFAVLGGDNLDDLKASADMAASKLVIRRPWRCALTVSDNSGISMSRSFGGDPDATDGFDAGFDRQAPPVPPAFYSCFQIDAFPNVLDQDIRDWDFPPVEAVDWNLTINNNPDNMTTIFWNPSDLPPQGDFMMCVGSYRRNMRGTAGFTFSGAYNKVIIQYRPLVTATASYAFTKPGWHMVSLPVVPQDSSVAVLFPGASGGQAYIWDAKIRYYISVTKMAPRKGYWIHLPNPAACSVTGAPLTKVAASFPEQGWYMVGSPAGGVDFSNPKSNPEGQVLSPAFGWETVMGSYFSAGNLDEKQGYWIAVKGACDMTVVGSGGRLGKGMQSSDWEPFYREYGNTPPGPPEISAVEQNKSDAPSEYALLQNFPNPFNAQTKITYILAEASPVELRIFDARGSLVHAFSPARREAGTHTVVWDAADRPSGMYLVELKAGSFRQMIKCLLLK